MSDSLCSIIFSVTIYCCCQLSSFRLEFQVSGPFKVLENEQSGTFVGKVKATDQDLSENAYIIYTITGKYVNSVLY